MASTLMKCAAVAGTAGFLENKYGSPLVVHRGEAWFMVTPAILLGTGFWALSHGFAVGKARNKYMKLAEKDGEKNVEERYGLPNLYAQGTSKHARAFNCVQRSHQHIFETYPLAIVSGFMGAWTFPIATACSTLMYAVGRYKLSMGYAQTDGDASKRYSSPLARGLWYGLVVNSILGAASFVMVVSGHTESKM